MKRLWVIAFLAAGATTSASGQDDKIERGVAAPPAKKEAAPAAAPPAKSDKTYPPVSLGVAAIATILIVGAVCIPLRSRDDDEE